MKLIMLQGLPASGKSTYATEVCKEQNWKRVNRDLIRTMLHCDKWSGKNESITVDIEKQIVLNLLAGGFSVIVDDCNLNPSNKDMWKQIAKFAEVDFSTKTFDTSIEECVERDCNREKLVGAHVIKNMALQYSFGEVPKEKIVICDIDGTIANIDHRLHFVKNDPKDWKSFFIQMVNDTPREDMREILIEHQKQGRTIIFVSGRPDTHREFTQNWLSKHGFDGWTLIMRKGGDTRVDTIVKAEIYDRYFADKEVVQVIDDRPSVIRMWKEKGLNVLDVGKGVEF